MSSDTIYTSHHSMEGGKTAKKNRALGLCLGASTVSLVQLAYRPVRDESGAVISVSSPRLIDWATHAHEGDPKGTLLNALEKLDLSTFDSIAATGRRFRKSVRLSSIAEPEAVELAYRFVKPEKISCPAIVSAGGETFMAYVLDGDGRIANVLTGNKCASGTGEFFLQQLRRLDVSIAEAANWAALEKPYGVSGRCSVFCKSDCTHATNKGVPKSEVTAGLCKMMADKVLELLKKVEKQNIMITGGTARNQMMISYLEKEIPGLIVPELAPCFEALGAALWAIENQTLPFPGVGNLFLTEAAAFDRLPALADAENMVTFKSMEKARVRPGDRCILGLDVGSTTTKAVLLRTSDKAIVADVYLRTNGDPVGASRQCYRRIVDHVQELVPLADISVNGLGVCGSGRQIAGLHAMTDGVINEIIAHSTAAVHFDPDVDTIFEIGGQDAKYTYITNGVPSDYAMNEACSAGTGSFLEESAYETLGIPMTDIAGIAMKGNNPPNFNDQCAAFIASDIKNAIHEGVAHEDIVAGLVYSICMNYTNRVKGNRPVGAKVFMQGGVCYNRAVPLAMASLVGKPIIVPPEPGLMGAFGVALEVKKRIESGLMTPMAHDLEALSQREARYGKSFACRGGKEKCDRACEINMVHVNGEAHPFGGACNRYYNLRQNIRFDMAKLDLVRLRNELIFNRYGGGAAGTGQGQGKQRVGLNRSFLVNTYYPFYATFFSELGFELVVPDSPSQAGIDRRGAAFCYPAELAHGFFHALVATDDPPEFVFLPHFKAVPTNEDSERSDLCPLVQGETFYLRTTFQDELNKLGKQGLRLLSPMLDLTFGLSAAEKPMVDTAMKMGAGRKKAKTAFAKAAACQEACLAQMQAVGKRVLAELAGTPEQMAVVLFGRPYNAFVEEAHMGIPRKLASRGILVIPLDFLPLDDQRSKRHMYWGMGQRILKAARFVEGHPQLFGTYITNFSCGPDSFVLGYFRDIMGRKPSLTLELDNHTADAGLETRIEAFLDVVSAYRQLAAANMFHRATRPFLQAKTIFNNGVPGVVTSTGETLPMTDPRVTLLIPSMGRISSEFLAALFRGAGFNAAASPPADEAVLKVGRANTSCKECLPLILTTGTLLSYINNGKRPDEVLVYFMVTGSGPCRFGQYSVFMEDLVKKMQIPNVTLLSLSSEEGYAGFAQDFERKAWWGIVTADLMEDIRSMILTNAVDPDQGIDIFEREWRQVLEEIKDQAKRGPGEFSRFEKQLIRTAQRLARIPMKRPPEEVPRIFLAGEIFVRRDGLSRQYLTEQLAEKGFATVCAPVAEWMNYTDWLLDKAIIGGKSTFKKRLGIKVKRQFTKKYEKRINRCLAGSGLIRGHPVDISAIIHKAAPFVSPHHCGEAILTVGGAIAEIVTHACGVIAIGPFGCMPNRMSESILSETMNRSVKLASEPGDKRLQTVLENTEDLPFLAIESDGSPFPQLINAKLEAFCLGAERLHRRMLAARG